MHYSIRFERKTTVLFWLFVNYFKELGFPDGDYLRNCVWTTLDTLERMLESILKTIMECAETIKTLVGFRWAII